MRELDKSWGKRKAYEKELFYSLKQKQKLSSATLGSNLEPGGTELELKTT